MPMSDEPQWGFGGLGIRRVERGRRGGGSVRVWGMSGLRIWRHHPPGGIGGIGLFPQGKGRNNGHASFHLEHNDRESSSQATLNLSASRTRARVKRLGMRYNPPHPE